MIVLVTAPLWLPLLGVTALAVGVAMGRPLFFRQERTGLRGRTFMLCKFRTMLAGTGEDHERLTGFGRWLRATSLDELPQLLHVLRGDMSLVGPRPLPVRYLPRYTAEQARRLEVRPGLTGWAQVCGRNSLSWEEKFKLDVWYVEHQSVCLDVRILWMSVWLVVCRRGVTANAHASMPEFHGASERAKDDSG